MMTDPIADMLTRIRNAGRVHHSSLGCPHSQLKEAICKVLSEEGFIAGYRRTDEGGHPTLEIDLRYDGGGAFMIETVSRISKPGRRVYVGADDVPKVRNGLGCAVVSTSKGVMCDRDAREAGVGGEILCEVW